MLTHKRLIALLTALMLVLAACSGDGETTDTTADSGDDTTATTAAPDDTGDDTTETTEAPMDEPADLAGTSVNVFGPEAADEGEAIAAALEPFAEETGIDITYVGAGDFSDQINVQVDGGNPPDIAIFPQPGKLADFSRQGFVLPLSDDLTAQVKENWSEAWWTFGDVDGTQYGIPIKTDLKSLVWYSPSRFAENGYEIPTTYQAWLDLYDQMIADGNTPLCVGIESGPATGWPFTDWVEDLTLRQAGPDFYDQWVAHEVPFNNETTTDIFAQINDLWSRDGAVFAAGGSIASTGFGNNAQPLVDGNCEMHRQASFFAAFMPEGTTLGPDGDINAFYFPAETADEQPVLGAGTLAAAFRDAPEVWAVMEYLNSPEYANARIEAQGGGFLTAVAGQDLSLYSPFEQGLVEILSNATVVRFDASDLMPAAVGSGSFWTAATDLVTGSMTPQEATDFVEESWPTG